MKDITIKITGKQVYDGVEEENMEFITEGKLYRRNGAVYMVYDESEVSGLSGCRTTLRLKGDTLRMKRIGRMGFNSEPYFEKGQRCSSVYETPYGPMEVEVLTQKICNDFDQEAMKGDIAISYDISVQGLAEGKNKIEIKVM